MEFLRKKQFNAQGRRICFIETENNADHVMGEIVVNKALDCKDRHAEAVSFTDKEFEGIQFAECGHPEKAQRLLRFCPVMTWRLEQEES